jgi:TPR repeat protein
MAWLGSLLVALLLSSQANPHSAGTRPQADRYYSEASGYWHERNYAAAIPLLTKAAELGNTQAMTDLGFAYANARGVTTDYDKAVFWWRKAAERNDAQAERSMALMYSLGLGGLPQDYNRVGDYLSRAAKHGQVQAMYEFGRLLSMPILLPAPDRTVRSIGLTRPQNMVTNKPRNYVISCRVSGQQNSNAAIPLNR